MIGGVPKNLRFSDWRGSFSQVDFLVLTFRERGDWLRKLQYCVFGLGNRQYEHFNKIATEVDKLVAEHGMLIFDICTSFEVVVRYDAGN
ncbi:MFS transporter multidrug-resistance type transporter [Orobanche hederae]